MSRGDHLETPCPDCGEPISLARLATALTPWHLRCPHCRARCRPAGAAMPLVLVFTLLAVVALGWLIYLVLTRPITGETVRVGIVLLVVMVLAELLISYVVCRGAGLVRRGRPDPPA